MSIRFDFNTTEDTQPPNMQAVRGDGWQNTALMIFGCALVGYAIMLLPWPVYLVGATLGSGAWGAAIIAVIILFACSWPLVGGIGLIARKRRLLFLAIVILLGDVVITLILAKAAFDAAGSIYPIENPDGLAELQALPCYLLVAGTGVLMVARLIIAVVSLLVPLTPPFFRAIRAW